MAIGFDGYKIGINVTGRKISRGNIPEKSNWLYAQIDIDFKYFKGSYPLFLETYDFEKFLSDIELLKKKQITELIFAPVEEGIYLKGKMDMTGKIFWEGIAKPEDGICSLNFKFETDNWSLETIAADAFRILHEFPVY